MRKTNAQKTEKPELHIMFQVGGSRYCLPATDVREIVKPSQIARVPGGPERYKGVMNLRGDVISVMCARTRLNADEGAGVELEPRVILAGSGGRRVGLLVDRVLGAKGLLSGDKEPPPVGMAADGSHVKGVAKDESGVVVMLDAEGLFEC